VRDFPSILGEVNPCPSLRKKREEAKIQLLKLGALKEGTRRQRATFMLSIEKDYIILIKDKEDPFEESSNDDYNMDHDC
jgi:hypothetical protein